MKQYLEFYPRNPEKLSLSVKKKIMRDTFLPMLKERGIKIHAKARLTFGWIAYVSMVPRNKTHRKTIGQIQALSMYLNHHPELGIRCDAFFV